MSDPQEEPAKAEGVGTFTPPPDNEEKDN